jgi:hypothetical protein
MGAASWRHERTILHGPPLTTEASVYDPGHGPARLNLLDPSSRQAEHSGRESEPGWVRDRARLEDTRP